MCNLSIEPKNQIRQRPLNLFSFITATTRDGSQVTEKRLQDVSETLKDSFVKGIALKCKEKHGKLIIIKILISHYSSDEDITL